MRKHHVGWVRFSSCSARKLRRNAICFAPPDAFGSGWVTNIRYNLYAIPETIRIIERIDKLIYHKTGKPNGK